MGHPAKAAFRAEKITSAQWNAAEIGLYSGAFGRNTMASGEDATAFGVDTEASDNNSTTILTSLPTPGPVPGRVNAFTEDLRVSGSTEISCMCM